MIRSIAFKYLFLCFSVHYTEKMEKEDEQDLLFLDSDHVSNSHCLWRRKCNLVICKGELCEEICMSTTQDALKDSCANENDATWYDRDAQLPWLHLIAVFSLQPMALRYQEGMKKQLSVYLEKLALQIKEKVWGCSFSCSLSLFVAFVDVNHQLTKNNVYIIDTVYLQMKNNAQPNINRCKKKCINLNLYFCVSLVVNSMQ